MSRQYDTDVRNALLAAYIAAIGPAPTLQVRTGDTPADTSAASTGTLLVEMTLPSTWMAAPSNGRSELAGSWAGTAVATGAPRHYRLFAAGSPNDCKEQGIVTSAIKLVTNGLTSAGSNVLNFASTTGVALGMSVTGIGVASGAIVLSFTSTTVTISAASLDGIDVSADIYFGDVSGDLWVPSSLISVTQSVSVVRRTLIAPGA